MRLKRVAAAVLLFALVACRQSPGPLRIGLATGLSGTTAAWGEAIRRGAQMAVDDANAAGGPRIELAVEDDQGKPDQSAVVVERLLTGKNVIAIVGCDTSSRSLAASPLCERARTAMISPTASAPILTQGKRFTFRVCATDDGEAVAIASLATGRLNLHRVVIIRDSRSDYSAGMATAFSAAFANGGGVVSGVFDYADGDSDFRAQLTAAAALSPEMIFVPGYYGDVAQIAIQARDLGIHCPMLGGSGWDSPKLTEIGGAALEGSWFVSGVRSASPRFVTSFKQKFGSDPDAANAESYDAAAIICAAIRKNGQGATRETVRDAIAATSLFPGASGTITLGRDGNARKPLAIFQVTGGKFVERGTIPASAR